MRVQIHANVRIRRIYFSDRLYADDEMPNEFKLFLPVTTSQKHDAKTKEQPAGAPPQEQKRDSKLAEVPPPTQEAVPVEEAVVEKVQLEEATPTGALPTPIEVESPPESPAVEETAAPAEAEPAAETKEDEGQAAGEGESPAAEEVAVEGGEEAAKEGPPEEGPSAEGPPAETPPAEGSAAEAPTAEGEPAAAPEATAGKLISCIP